jgi:hypothetical protein
MLHRLFSRRLSEADFVRHIGRLTDGVDMTVTHLDGPGRAALCGLGGDATGYDVYVASLDTGATAVQVFSTSHWPGDPPPVAVRIARTLDASSDRAVFRAKRLTTGVSRLVGYRELVPLTVLTADAFGRATAELAFKLLTADRALAAHGVG